MKSNVLDVNFSASRDLNELKKTDPDLYWSILRKSLNDYHKERKPVTRKTTYKK